MTDLVAPEPPLPQTLTSLIGREREICALRDLVTDPRVRIVTITGPGGVGKTRVAIAVAHEYQQHHADGVWFVRLDALADPRQVIPAVAAVGGVRELPGQPTELALAAALRSRSLLLVLDNFEHLLDAALPVVDLLEACPAVTALVTSRSRLRVSGEHTYEVQPLAVSHDMARSREALNGADATQLFAERARAVIPDFALNAETTPLVTDICRKLDGLPLAIELAAARLHHLSLATLAGQLTERRHALAGGVRDAPQRLRTLHDAVAWSYDLLAPDQQRLFRELSVFRGGWTIEAALAVCSNDADVADNLGVLVDHQLVRRLIQPDGSTRFGMLETIRAFALEELRASGELDHLRARHASSFLDLAEHSGAVRVLYHQSGYQRLVDDYDNLRTALSWALDRGRQELALRMCNALAAFWYARGLHNEANDWLQRALAAGGDVDARVRATALVTAGWMNQFTAEFDLAIAQLEQAIAIARTTNELETLAAGLAALAIVSLVGQRHGPDVRALARETWDLFPRVSDPRTRGNIVYTIGLCALIEGDGDSALAAFQQALAIYRGAGDIQAINWSSWSIGGTMLSMGKFQQAGALLRETLTLATRWDDKHTVFQSIFGLGCVAAGLGEAARAARLWGYRDTLEAAGFSIHPVALHLIRYDLLLATVREQLDEATFAAATAEGRAMSEADAIADALRDDCPGRTSEPEEAGAATPLTPREIEILRLVVAGRSNKEISSDLSLSVRTVERHLSNIYAKIDAHGRADAVAYAFRHDLV